jgi:hypothetical protein
MNQATNQATNQADLPCCTADAWRTAFFSLAALACFGLAGCATPPDIGLTSPPAALQTRPEEQLGEVLTAVGDETYHCERIKVGAPGDVAGPNTELQWVSIGSEATLTDSSRQNVGSVAPGGYFVGYDGSYIKAHLELQSQVQMQANSLTWALYRTRYNASQRSGEGRFALVSSIQRVDTTGGIPIAQACEVEGTRLLMPYHATYKLYRPGSASMVTESGVQP